MKKIIIATAALLLAASTAAFAAPARPYISGGIGAFSATDSTITDTQGYTGKASFSTGPAFTIAYGAALDSGFRFEGELSHRRASLDGINVAGFTVPVDSRITATSLLANGFYDIKLPGTLVKPYIGAGLGFTSASLKKGTVLGEQVWGSDDDVALAYQVGAGVGFPIDNNFTLDLGYRYFGTALEFDVVEGDLHGHNFMFGVRYAF